MPSNIFHKNFPKLFNFNFEVAIMDTVEVYINDVLVEHATDESSHQWTIDVADAVSIPGPGVITIVIDDDVVAPVGVAPTITESFDLEIEDVTVYVPAETIDTDSIAVAPTIAEGLDVSITNLILIEIDETIDPTGTAPTITEDISTVVS